MKKIVFVEKDDSSTYDPVSTFFANSNAKKANSVAKPSATNQTTNNKNVGASVNKNIEEKQPIKKVTNTGVNSNVNERQKRIVGGDEYGINKQKPVTGKIGRKGEYPPPRKIELTNNKKQETIYGAAGTTTAGSRKNVRNMNEQVTQKQKQINQINEYNNEDQYSNKPKNEKLISSKNTNEQQPKSSSSSQLQSLKNRIKQLQSTIQQYTLKIQQYEQKQEKYIKMQQKYNKLQKQHKLCGQNKQVSKKLKQREEQIKKLISKQQIPYGKKRQVMLQNQMNNLKKINRELVTRIKNYRGTDLVEVSINANKYDVLFKEYDHSIKINDEGEIDDANNEKKIDTGKIESIVYRIIQQIEKYIAAKSNKEMLWTQDKKLLIELNNYCKDLSMECIGFQFKIPASNKECINIYDEIEKYRHSLEPIISKYDLNFVITEENIELINRKNSQISYNIEIRENITKIWNEQPKKFKKIAQASAYYLSKCKAQSKYFEQNCNMSYIILAHCLAQIAFMETWINKMTSNLKESLTNLDIRLKELKQMAELGEAGKQSLYLYIRTNLDDLMIKVPQLQLQVKSIGSMFKKAKVNAKNAVK